VTGPESAPASIVLLYDVFGFNNALLLGADLLAHGAHSATAHSGFRVYVPDFLEGHLADPAWFGPEATADAKKSMGALFGPGGFASADVLSTKVNSLSGEIKGEGKVGILGYCWGAKVRF